MAAISLLLIAFDTSSIDAYCSAQTKKRPIKLEFAGKSREEMVRLAYVLNHVKFRSNLVELNLSGCIFDRSTFFEIMAHLKKYPSLTLFNLSNAKICRDLGLTEYAQELQKLNKLMPNLKIIVDSPQT
ncbi:hypothetical protein [Paraburkholderia bonniea]|uniref:hypothetical protein n=1 Tax=Paraburkholderia bonniea TaxID=2152891 RepID=UPI00129125A8|nr:hypothetical protein [Paraburkholderia bonniea]